MGAIRSGKGTWGLWEFDSEQRGSSYRGIWVLSQNLRTKQRRQGHYELWPAGAWAIR